MIATSNVISVVCVLLDTLDLLFLCNLEGKCAFVSFESHLLEVLKYILKIAKCVARCFLKKKLKKLLNLL